MTHPFAPLASVCAGALLALGLASAHAAPITEYRGTDATPLGTVRVGEDPAVERARFIDALDPARTRFESFESFFVDSTAPLSLFGATAPALPVLTMPADPVPAGSLGEISNVGAQGRFNTSPRVGDSRWWEASGNFSISFTDPIQAFAFYATDLGDFRATLTIEWFLNNDPRGKKDIARLSIGNGTLDFWGLTDTGGFNRVSFTITQVGTIADQFDFIGFDDLIAGYLRAAPEPPPPQGVPEPLTLALVGLGLAGIALTRRRRR